MTVTSWSPDDDLSNQIPSSEHLITLATLCPDNQSCDLLGQIDNATQTALINTSKLPAPQWQAAMTDLDATYLIGLIRFFALLESQLNDFDPGHLSPAIAANRCLKAQGQKLDRDTLLWLRNHCPNRYVPNGALG